MAVDDINAAGGMRGERLRVKFADDGCDPRKAVEVANRLRLGGRQGRGRATIAPALSIPASKVYEKAGIVADQPGLHPPEIHR